MNGYFTSLFYTGQVLSLPRVSRVRTNKSHEVISIFFFFGRRKIYMKLLSVCAVLFRNQGAYDSLIHIPSRVFRHFVETLQNHWFKCQKIKNSEAVTGCILELYVYFTQSFKILCRRRLLILRELDVRDHFLAIFAFFRRRALYKDIVYGTKYHI